MADQSAVRTRILSDSSSVNEMLELLQSYGHNLIVADFYSRPQGDVRALLGSVEVVLLNVTTWTWNALVMIRDISATASTLDVAPQLLCFSTAPRDPQFVLAIEKCGARCVRIGDAAMLLEAIDLLLADRASFFRNRLCFHALHRFAFGGCAPGEEVSAILFPRADTDPQLRLALSERLVFNFLAQHRRIALDSFQIASGLNGEWFYRDHASNSGIRQQVKVRVPAIKVIVGRIRDAMAVKFADAQVRNDPFDVLQSLPATGSNRVLYKLNADVQFIHSMCRFSSS